MAEVDGSLYCSKKSLVPQPPPPPPPRSVMHKLQLAFFSSISCFTHFKHFKRWRKPGRCCLRPLMRPLRGRRNAQISATS